MKTTTPKAKRAATPFDALVSGNIDLFYRRLFHGIRLAPLFAIVIVFGIAATATIHLDMLITGPVIEKTVADLAANFERNGRKFSDYHGDDSFLRTLSREARTEIFTNVVGGEDKAKEAVTTGNNLPALWYGITPDADTATLIGPWNTLAKFGRSALSTPTGLKTAYLLYKDKVVDELQKQTLGIPVRNELRILLPYFDGTADPKKVHLLKARSSFEQATMEGSLDAVVDSPIDCLMNFEKKLRTNGVTFAEQEAYEFAERRRAEGDDVLVKAYAEIIADMIKALTPTDDKDAHRKSQVLP